MFSTFAATGFESYLVFVFNSVHTRYYYLVTQPISPHMDSEPLPGYFSWGVELAAGGSVYSSLFIP